MTPTVEIASGRVAGIAGHGVHLFRGIPYAAPPTGARRFRAPEPAAPWAGVREATAFGPVAPQNASVLGQLLSEGTSRQDEDCLTLNVWTTGTNHRPRPVMVWIHGGAFVIGAGSQLLYDGARLARRGDLVLVTINYRLGALGRLHLGALVDGRLDTTANAALLDQIAALRWVQENIGQFGGDPRRVTIFGESAGSMSVSTLLGTPAARGLFHRAIMQSGAANFVSTAAQGAEVAERLLRELDIGRHDVERLWTVPAAQLLAAQGRAFDRLGSGTGLPFQPIVDGDALPAPPLDAIAGGLSQGVPIVVGSNLDEMTLFGLMDQKAATLDADGLLRRLARLLPAGAAERAVARYRTARSARGADVRPRALWYAIDSDRTFRAPAMQLAERHRAHEPRTWAYLFTWPSPLLGGRLGSCHALEIPFVFGTLEDPMVAQFAGHGPDALRLALAIQDAWIAFAHGGTPAHPALPSWPTYAVPTRATMILDRALRVEEAPLEAERAFWDTGAGPP